MKTYRVTWAPSVLVTAKDEREAWAKFCEGNDEAQKHPKLYPQIIEEVTPEDATQAERDALVREVDESVDKLPTNEAVERIGRMNSRERLNQIVSSDQRHDVSRAARKRLSELPAETPSST